MVQRVNRPHGELHVAFGIDIVQGAPRHFADVLYVHIFIDHDNHFGKHGLTQAPDRIYYFARVAWVALADRHQHYVVEDPFRRHTHVADFRQLQAHQGQEDSFDRFAHVEVFHGWGTDDGGGVDGVATVRYAGDVEDRILVGKRVISGVVAERTFSAGLGDVHIAFQNELGVRGNFNVVGDALHHFDGAPPEEAGDHHLVKIWRKGENCRVHGGRIRPDGDRNIHSGLPRSQTAALVFGTLFVGLPVHAGGSVVVNLHAVHAAVALAGLGVLGEDHRQGNVGAAVLRPAG